MVFVLFVLALALVPGMQCVTVQTMDIPSNGIFAVDVNGQQVHIQTLPAFNFEDEDEELPVLRPNPIPEVEAVVPDIISINPCDSCFEYMSTLIQQLSDSNVELVPHPMPEVEVIQPEEEEGEFNILPHPMPQVDVVELPQARPLPIEYLRN